MFQSYGYQSIGFQSVFGVGSQQPTGGTPYTFSFPKRKEEIKRQKTELQKVQSVIYEYERRRDLAEESLAIAEATERNRLLKAQNELITEINRLLVVKAEMMARIKRSEKMLIIMMAMRRKRLRAF